jgi:hypothetical protein
MGDEQFDKLENEFLKLFQYMQREFRWIHVKLEDMASKLLSKVTSTLLTHSPSATKRITKNYWRSAA